MKWQSGSKLLPNVRIASNQTGNDSSCRLNRELATWMELPSGNPCGHQASPFPMLLVSTANAGRGRVDSRKHPSAHPAASSLDRSHSERSDSLWAEFDFDIAFASDDMNFLAALR
jgi:hypothetical protein